MIIFVVGTLAILAALAWGTYRTAHVLHELAPALNPLLLPAENVLRLLLVAACLGLGRVSGLTDAQLGWLSRDPSRDLALGVIFGMAVALSVPPVTQVAVKFLGRRIYSPAVVRSILPRDRREWTLVPLSLITGVFLEELLFRSLLLGGFGSFAPPLVLAVTWSITFGALHVPQGALGMVVAGALGLLLSVLFLLTGGLLAPFAAHYVINLVQLIWAKFDRSWLETWQDAGSHP